MAKDFNNLVVVEHYDEHIRKLIPGYELIHLQVHALLETYLNKDTTTSLSQHRQILIVGCGTGYELQYLSEQFPSYSFTAIDPALNMLEKAKQHIERLGLSKRVTFITGDTSILKTLNETYDAVLAILVSHFVPFENKTGFFQHIAHSLKENGFCISVDLTRIDSQDQLRTLQLISLKTGLTEQQSQTMIDRIEQDFYLVSAEKMFKLYEQASLNHVNIFTQIINYYGFIGFKS